MSGPAGSGRGVPPLPFTVIGGFLGAGKSTLLNHLLRDAGGRRIAVVVNDFGSVNIDAELIASHDGDTIALTNGCICCSLAGAFALALPGLRDRQPPLDHVVVEASGVADPFTVGQYGTLPGFRLEGVIVLADAETIRDHAADPRLGHQVRRQLERADLVVLNKVDLVTPEAAAGVEAWLRELVPGARVVRAVDGEVPISVLLGELGGAERSPATEPAHPHPFVTATLRANAPVHRAALEALLERLPDRLLRLKGFVRLEDNRWMEVQVVGRRWRLRAAPPSDVARDRSVLVAIGSGEAVAEVASRVAALGFSHDR